MFDEVSRIKGVLDCIFATIHTRKWFVKSPMSSYTYGGERRGEASYNSSFRYLVNFVYCICDEQKIVTWRNLRRIGGPARQSLGSESQTSCKKGFEYVHRIRTQKSEESICNHCFFANGPKKKVRTILDCWN